MKVHWPTKGNMYLCLLLWWRNSIALLYVGTGIAMAGKTMPDYSADLLFMLVLHVCVRIPTLD